MSERGIKLYEQWGNIKITKHQTLIFLIYYNLNDNSYKQYQFLNAVAWTIFFVSPSLANHKQTGWFTHSRACFF